MIASVKVTNGQGQRGVCARSDVSRGWIVGAYQEAVAGPAGVSAAVYGQSGRRREQRARPTTAAGSVAKAAAGPMDQLVMVRVVSQSRSTKDQRSRDSHHGIVLPIRTKSESSARAAAGPSAVNQLLDDSSGLLLSHLVPIHVDGWTNKNLRFQKGN